VIKSFDQNIYLLFKTRTRIFPKNDIIATAITNVTFKTVEECFSIKTF